MSERPTVTSERVEDIPLLLAQMERMGVPSLLDEYFPTQGNWQGLSLGWTATIWLAHILSEGDHRLNHVQPWAEKRLETLSRCIGQEVRALDFSDDRLADVLSALSQDVAWDGLEMARNGHLRRLYDLNPQQVRLDSTPWVGDPRRVVPVRAQQGPPARPAAGERDALHPGPAGLASGHHGVARTVRRRPAVPPGHPAGAGGGGPAGAVVMGALRTRAFTQAGGDFYLGPLSERQLPPEVLEA